MEWSEPCVLVASGGDKSGRKGLSGLRDGYRPAEQSRRELLLDLKRRGLA